MTSYLSRLRTATADLGAAAVPLGRQIDIWFNVTALGGRPGQTVSEHAAEDAAAGQRWACVLCQLLNIVVQPKHCQVTLDPNGVTPLSADARAAGAFLVFSGAITIAVFIGTGALLDWTVGKTLTALYSLLL